MAGGYHQFDKSHDQGIFVPEFSDVVLSGRLTRGCTLGGFSLLPDWRTSVGLCCSGSQRGLVAFRITHRSDFEKEEKMLSVFRFVVLTALLFVTPAQAVITVTAAGGFDLPPKT